MLQCCALPHTRDSTMFAIGLWALTDAAAAGSDRRRQRQRHGIYYYLKRWPRDHSNNRLPQNPSPQYPGVWYDRGIVQGVLVFHCSQRWEFEPKTVDRRNTTHHQHYIMDVDCGVFLVFFWNSTSLAKLSSKRVLRFRCN